MTANYSNPIFTDEAKAREHLEAVRWPNGPTCPHCGNADGETIHRLEGKSGRPGLYQCNACRQHFTVTVGTVYERSHIPLNKWLFATYLMTASKKGISAHQIHRMLGITYKSAWFMCHRIRESMTEAGSLPPVGGEGKVVEADETYVGRKPGTKVRRGTEHKNAVMALVERGGKARTFRIERANTATVKPIVETNVDRASRLMTDEARHYTLVGRQFASHESVEHSAGEYVRGDAYTNTIEGYFSIFKRGMAGVYQHCGEQHLHRYLSEFEFRYNNRTALGVNDAERADAALKGIEGKRLTYRRTCEAAA